MNLLEKAKSSPRRMNNQEVTSEHVELALAYLRNEVSILQICDALETKGKEHTKLLLLKWVVEAYRRGYLIEPTEHTKE